MKQPVPKFIQQFKERTNQKESPTLDSKHKTDRNAEADDEERDDETPLVCISSSNVSQEEAESFIKESYGDKADVRIEDPKKRSHENAGGNRQFLLLYRLLNFSMVNTNGIFIY